MSSILLESFHYRRLLIALLCLSGWTFAQRSPGDWTVTYSGNYRILQCGSSGQAGSQASILGDILPKVWTHLQAVITDSKLGTSSSHGFTAFFKTNDNKVAVQDRFQKLIEAPPIILSPHRAQITRNPTAPPTIVCANQGDPHTEYIYNSLCKPNEHTLGGHRPNTEVTVLCPLFWRMSRDGWIEPLSGFCPRLVNNALSPNTAALTFNLMSIIVHELIHVYNEDQQVPAGNETYHIQDAVELNATDSMNNAANFAFYFAAVVAGCTSFPTLPNAKDELRS